MPEHLAAYPLEKPLLDLLKELGKWLEDNGTFAPGIQNFDKCINSDLTERVRQVWEKINVLFAQIQGTSDVSGTTLWLKPLIISIASKALGYFKITTWRWLDDEHARATCCSYSKDKGLDSTYSTT
jgi:hypothetical protein